MAGHLELRLATARDVSFVMAWLNPDDERELMCQVADGAKAHEVGLALLMSSETYVACWKGVPAAVFGVSPLNAATLQVFMLGTRHSWRCAPMATRFLKRVLRDKAAEGYHAMEARSIEGHERAHRWLRATGAVTVGEPFVFGKDREKFLLFRWTTEALDL